MFYVLSLASAALYGAADFVGGLATRRANAIAVVVISQFAGLALLAASIPFLPPASPSAGDLAWGAVVGLAGGVGVALLYKALAIGTMGVVAPTTAVCAVAIPVIAGMLLGERPGPLAAAGIALAMIAIVLVSQQASVPEVTHGVRGAERPNRSLGRRRGQLPPGLALALLSGVAIGLFFLALARTSEQAGMWPLVAARTTSVTLFAVIAAAAGYSLRLRGSVGRISAAGGVIDMLANVLYLLAARRGPLTIVVTLSSLYPASTVVLARVVLGERLSAVQQVGIVCALAAVVMIVGG